MKGRMFLTFFVFCGAGGRWWWSASLWLVPVMTTQQSLGGGQRWTSYQVLSPLNVARWFAGPGLAVTRRLGAMAAWLVPAGDWRALLGPKWMARIKVAMSVAGVGVGVGARVCR
jgi:hypothetical protein